MSRSAARLAAIELLRDVGHRGCPGHRDRLRVGAVLINSTSDVQVDAMPFGGFTRSGIGRKCVESSILAFSEPKVVAIRSRRAT
ncbi:MAG TPA: aldehyde dehydrogenase family protein [Propionibacteriaceae bacterium]|nr:aldehyde dehydrogenase family protein [Propionibacteriaceae bacterium]